MPTRSLRFAAWVIAVTCIGAGAALGRADIPHPSAVAAAWSLVHLSALVWLLGQNPRGAIRLPTPMSECIVLAATPLLLWLATYRWGAGAALSAAFLVLNHVRRGPWSLRAPPTLGNPWRLTPALWHPALWLVALHAPGTPGAWLGVGLAPAAQIASVLARSPAPAVRAVGWIVWAAVAGATVAALWSV